MTGNGALFRVAMARPSGSEHATRSRSVLVVLLVLAAIAAAIVLVPHYIT
jgi:hypothetical protein